MSKKPHYKDLEIVPNQYPQKKQTVSVSIPEFNCVCPRTGLPDFGCINIVYCQNQHIVELKSLKLYIVKYRNVGIFHEDVTNTILKDLSDLIKPRYMCVIGYWKVRGGIITTVTTKFIKNGWKDSNRLISNV